MICSESLDERFEMVNQTPGSPLTPAHSGDENESEGDEEQVVSVSASFYPSSHDTRHDTIFRTLDAVLFYVSSEVMQRDSKTAFGSILSSASKRACQDEIIDISETSQILNVILHTLYGSSCAQYAPSFDTLETAVARMPQYGINPSSEILPGTHLYTLLLSHAPVVPLRLYTLAAHHDLHDLAVNCSSHLLSVPLSAITDANAEEIGPLYLKKLMCLHLQRMDLFKNIILRPPALHPAARDCSFVQQKRLGRAWALVSAYLAWVAKIDIPVSTLQTCFSALEDDLYCGQCKGTLKARIREVVVQWAAAKRTI